MPITAVHGRLTMLSGDRPGVSGYYDLTPESPAGKQVVLFSFDGDWRGRAAGRIAIVDRDGNNLRLLGPPIVGSSQNGAMQQWIDDEHVASIAQSDDARGTQVLPLDGRAPQQLAADIRMFNPATGKGLGFLQAPDHPNPRSAVYLMDFRSGECRQLFTLRQAALHPVAKDFSREQIDCFHLKHSKWAPDGSRFFFVMTNEGALRGPAGRSDMPRVKAIMMANGDGSGLHHHTEFGHHPLWGPDSRFVYAFARHPGGQALMVYPLEGKPGAMLENVAGVHPSLSPDGRWIVTDRWVAAQPDPKHENASVVLIDPSSGQERILATMRVADTSQETGCHPHPAWARSGRRVYFNATHDGTLRLWAVDFD